MASMCLIERELSKIPIRIDNATGDMTFVKKYLNPFQILIFCFLIFEKQLLLR